MSAEMWKKVKHFVGIPEEEDEMEGYVGRPHVGGEQGADVSHPHHRQRRSRNPHPEKGGNLNNIIGMSSTMSQSEMLIVEPKSFDDALDIVESLRGRKAVIINLTGLDQEQAQRLIDFVAGATHALDGNQERVGEGIFLFSPSNVMINALGTEQPWLNRDARDLFWRVK